MATRPRPHTDQLIGSDSAPPTRNEQNGTSRAGHQGTSVHAGASGRDVTRGCEIRTARNAGFPRGTGVRQLLASLSFCAFCGHAARLAQPGGRWSRWLQAMRPRWQELRQRGGHRLGTGATPRLANQRLQSAVRRADVHLILAPVGEQRTEVIYRRTTRIRLSG